MVAYLMGDASVIGFGSILWGRGDYPLSRESSVSCIRDGRQISGRGIIYHKDRAACCQWRVAGCGVICLQRKRGI